MVDALRQRGEGDLAVLGEEAVHITGGKAEGMQFMDESTWEKLRAGMVTAEEAYMKAIDKTRFKKFLPEGSETLGEASGENPMTH